MLNSSKKAWDGLYTKPVHWNMCSTHPSGCVKWSHVMWKGSIRTSIYLYCILYTENKALPMYNIQLADIFIVYENIHILGYILRRSPFRLFEVHWCK